MDERIDKLASRHIAKCLDFLGDTVAPTQIVSIKRSFRYFADDVKQVIHEEARKDEETNRKQ
jgi:hypothetical protein